MNTPVAHAPFNRGYAVLLLRVLDVAVQTVIWRDYDITISAQCGLEIRKAKPAAWARVLNWFLNKCEANHCELAITCDRERAYAAIGILGPPPPDMPSKGEDPAV